MHHEALAVVVVDADEVEAEAVSRVMVQVVLRDSRSTSPDCSAVKRCCAVSGMYCTLLASPNTAAATARQTSTSMPVHLPWVSGCEKPASAGVDAADQAPRALIASRSLPAYAVPAAPTSVAATMPAAMLLLEAYRPSLRGLLLPSCQPSAGRGRRWRNS